MIAAFVVSVVFLGCYLTYHEALHAYTGRRGRAFVGSDLARWLYFSILIPHVLLAAAVPVLALRVFWLAWRERWVQPGHACTTVESGPTPSTKPAAATHISLRIGFICDCPGFPNQYIAAIQTALFHSASTGKSIGIRTIPGNSHRQTA
ncbi:MAG: DUF420 domain-containing protein, partial [Planctomycetaceae bacterium]